MKPLFTIHIGEYLTASYIEKKFSSKQVWIPSRDIGVDLLVTDKSMKKATSLQVKYSKDFLPTHVEPEFRDSLVACGWWTFSRKKIQETQAEYWVLILYSFKNKDSEYIVVDPKELLKRYDKIHGKLEKIQSYFWVTNKKQCFETRGLKKKEKRLLKEGGYVNPTRNFTKQLNNWPFK